MKPCVIYTVHTYNTRAEYSQVHFRQANERYDAYQVLKVNAKKFFRLMECNMNSDSYMPKFVDWDITEQYTYLDYLAPQKLSLYPVKMPQVAYHHDALSFTNGIHSARVLEFLEPHSLFIEVSVFDVKNFQSLLI